MATFFGVFVLICGLALAFIGWLLLKDSTQPLNAAPRLAEPTPVSAAEKKSKRKKKSDFREEPIRAADSSSSVKTAFVSSFLNKLSFFRKIQPKEVSIEEYVPRPSLNPQTAPSIPKLDVSPNLSQEEEKHIEEEIDATIHVHELKEKYERLDRLFKEKASDLEKAQRALETEIRTKKEFNKVKDILEKELKDTKDKVRNVQVELISARTEAESSQKRIGQLETKVTKLEKQILDKEKEIDELLKKQAKLVEDAKKASAALVSHKPTLPVEAPPIENVPAAPIQEKAAESAPVSPVATDTVVPATVPLQENTESPSEKKPEETHLEKASEEKEKVEEENKLNEGVDKEKKVPTFSEKLSKEVGTPIPTLINPENIGGEQNV